MPVFVWQHDEDAVGGVADDEGGVVHGDGVGLPDNARQRVARPYKRHGVGQREPCGVGNGRRLLPVIPPPHAPACHAAHQGDEEGDEEGENPPLYVSFLRHTQSR